MTKAIKGNIIIFNFEKCIFSIPPNNEDFDNDRESDFDMSDEYDDDEYEYEEEEEEEEDDDDDDDDDDEDEDVERVKRIDGFDNYSVSNHGRVRNDKTNRILKPGLYGEGYHTVNLYKNKKKKPHSVHRLVGLAFIQNPENRPKVDQIDEVNTNNHVRNLRWVTKWTESWQTNEQHERF